MSEKRLPNWLKLATYFLAIVAALILGWLAAKRMVDSINYRNSDFFTFYLAGWMNWQGQDPYATKQWIAGHQTFNATWIPNPIFPYPLPLATLLAPLGLLDLYTAFVSWVLLSAVLIAITSFALLAQEKVPHRIQYLLPLLAGVFLFRPTLVTFRDGQLGAILLFIIACTAILWKKGAWLAGGMALGLLILKPSLGVPFLALTGLWLVFERQYTALAGLVVSGVILALIGFARDLNWPVDFLLVSNRKLSVVFGVSPTLWGISGAICQYQQRCTWLLGGLLAVGLFLAAGYSLWKWRRNIDPLAAMGIISATTVVITPYIWAYDQVLVLIAVIATIAIAARSNIPYLAIASYPILLSALSILLVLVAMRVGRDHWSALVPLLGLVMLIIVLSSRRLSQV